MPHDDDAEKGQAAPDLPPEGGPQAWLCVLGGFCTLFCSFGWINAIGVFQDYYATHQPQQYSASTIAWIPSLEVFMNFCLGPIVGSILLLRIGTFLHVFGLMMTSFCTEYYQFILAQGICSPIGVCMIFFPAMGTITTWFVKRRGLAFSIIAAGSSLGGVTLPIMVQHLIDLVNFGWAMRITAFVILFLMIIANSTITSRVPPAKKPFRAIEFVQPLPELPFAIVVSGSFLIMLGLFIPINYSISAATAAGMAPGLALYMLPILNAASLFGRIIPGYLADKLRRLNIFVTMYFLTSVLILAVWIPVHSSDAGIIVFNALYGFASGAFVSMVRSVVAQISPYAGKIGVRTGTFFAIVGVASLVSSPIGGMLVGRLEGDEYLGCKIFAGCVIFVGAVVLMVGRGVVGGWRWRAKV